MTHFNGPAYEEARDHARLTGQLKSIAKLMADGHWRGLAEISAAVTAPTASVSAQLRHLRKERFGGSIVERKRAARLSAGGLWLYRVSLSQAARAIFNVENIAHAN